ncbi:MAG: enoyl-CoA hydratase, partial [bacterium]|nr:enoyl-CoA hydratase [bacterium]
MAGRILVEKDGPLGWLVFDHAERRNAISSEMWSAIPDATQELEADDDVRVVIMRGAGDVAFVSGADISEFEEKRTGAAKAIAYEGETGRAFAALMQVGKPVLAMIHGYCVGGGMATALAADLRYSADDGVFAIPAARLGLGYHESGLAALVDLVGPAAAKEIFFTARRFSAEEALRLGILTEVLPKAKLEEGVRERALGIAQNAPLTLRSVKRIVRELGRDERDRDRAAITESITRCF